MPPAVRKPPFHGLARSRRGLEAPEITDVAGDQKVAGVRALV